MKKFLFSATAVATSLLVSQAAFAGAVLDKVKKDGVVVCGVNTAAPGFSNADSQ